MSFLASKILIVLPSVSTLGIELDNLTYFTHTCCFIGHDSLSLLKRKNYDIRNSKIIMQKQYDNTKKAGGSLLRSLGAVCSGQVGALCTEFPL